MVTPGPLRIVFFGTPRFAVPSLQRLFESMHMVVAVVSQPDRPRGRGHHTVPTATKALALEHGIRVLQPERLKDSVFLGQLGCLDADLGVVAAYGRLLPETLLELPRLGMINVHGSLLPRWRGAAPVHRAVIAGDTETGVTIMRVVKALDAGPMFAKAPRAIGPDETSVEVETALAEIGAALLLDVVNLMAAGEAVETPQDDAQATYAPKITREESAVDWALPAARIHDLVRGLQPWPLVSARIDGERVLIHRTKTTDQTGPQPPGTIVRADGERLEVVAGDGAVLRLMLIQPEGRRVMSAREFLAGRRVEPGARLERA